MGLLDNLTQGALGALANALPAGQTSGLTQGLVQLLEQQGGIQGLAAKFQQQGLGEVVNSWISTGQNLPITAEQLQSVLGNQQIQALAQQAGIPLDQGLQALTQLLPGFIDHLTPNGQVPASGNLVQAGLDFLKKLGG